MPQNINSRFPLYIFILFNFINQVPATPELYNEFIIENYFLKVILPEGVADVSFKTNIALERKPDESRYTFLDTTGRTVVVFEGKDVTYQHAAKIAVTYNWNSILIFKVLWIKIKRDLTN